MPDDSLWFIFSGGSLLLDPGAGGTFGVPRGDAPPLPPAGALHNLGVWGNTRCTAYAVARSPENGGWVPTDLRAAYRAMDPTLRPYAGKGFQMIHWDKQSRFCPSCGTATRPATAISKSCPSCGQEIFPPITPAVLILIRKDDSILLARNRTFRGPHHSILAGFLEPGETLEECVRRETREETSLEIDNITYFGSQPWPFPSNLMVGFVADYKSGEIALQESELASGGFFTRDNLPELPTNISLSRRMIDWWIADGK